MRVTALAVVSLITVCGVAIALQKTNDEAALLAIEEKWDAASVKGDTAALGAIWADTFISTTTEGKVRAKAEMLNQVKSGAIKYQLAKVDDMKVFVYGDAAVVNGR